MVRSGANWAFQSMLLPISKINIFKDNKSTKNTLNLSQLNLEVHVSAKINTFIIYKGGLGEQKKILKIKTKWRLSFIFFFVLFFGRAP